MPDRVIDNGIKIQAFVLVVEGATAIIIKAILGLSQPQIRQIQKKIIEKKWEDIINSLFFYIKDIPYLDYLQKNLPAFTEQLIIITKFNKIRCYIFLNKLAYKLNILINFIYYYLY